MDKIDYTKIPPEVLESIKKRESNRPENKQVVLLQDVADILQELLNVLDGVKNNTDKKDIGAVLLDIRENLQSINNKKDIEIPDQTKPIIASLEKLEKSLSNALKSVDVSPVFKPNIQVDSPKVTVEPPDIDLSGVEKIIKNDLPEAFKKSISKIPPPPEVKLSPLEDLIRDMAKDLSAKLQDIDRATRMKPIPGSMKVTNSDGSRIGNLGLIPVPFTRLTFSDADANGNYQLATVKNGLVDVGSLTLDYDENNKLTDVYWTSL